MKQKAKAYKLLQNIFWGFFVLTFVLFPQRSNGALTLPATACDQAQANAAHLVNNIVKEDGTKAFTYGADNNSFVSKTGNVITLNIKLLFTTTASSVIKIFLMDQNCTVVAGLAFQQQHPQTNTFAYDWDNDRLTVNNQSPTKAFPNGLVRYLWAEVWDGVTGSTLASYSYLVDFNDPKNPTGTTGTSDPTGGGGIYDQTPFYEPTGLRPVLIIPGIAGTDLFYGSEFIWPNVARMLEEPNDYFLTDALALNENGESVRKIEMGDIVKKIEVTFLKVDVFKKIIELLEEKNYVAEKSYFTFRYDWRLDLGKTSTVLAKRIEQIRSLTKFKKIDVIAHSMGGLVLKNYIKEFGEQNLKKIIFVGTPHLGAPKAAKVLLRGDKFSILWLDPKRVQEIARNAPAVYELLPNQEYFSSFSSGYILPYGLNSKILDYNQTSEFLTEQELNQKLINQADEFFARNLHEMKFNEVDAYNIAGCKTGTQAQYDFGLNNSYIRNVNYTSGDGTVPLVSADYVNISTDNKFYVKNGKHSELSSQEGVRELILGILSDNPKLSKNVKRNSDFCRTKGKVIIWRSPVEVHVYNGQGEHTGPVANGLETNIPGVDYEIFGEQKFMFLPDEGNYHVVASGQALGHFDLAIAEVDEGIVINTTIFNDVAITETSKIKFDADGGIKVVNIEVDYSGNGEFKIIEPTGRLTNRELYDSIPPITKAPVKDLDGNLKEITLEAKDDNSGVLEVRYSLYKLSSHVYTQPLIIPAADIKNFEYYSVDNAGNNEEPKTLELKVLGKSIGINFIPDGTLVLDESDSQTVYMIGNNGKKYGFISEEAFKKLGYTFDGIIRKDLSGHELAGFIGSEYDYHPNGSLIKSGQTIWWMNFDKRFAIPSMEVFKHCKFKLDQVVEANVTDMARPEYVMEKSFCN